MRVDRKACDHNISESLLHQNDSAEITAASTEHRVDRVLKQDECCSTHMLYTLFWVGLTRLD